MFKSALICFLLAGALLVEAKNVHSDKGTPRGLVDGIINGILAPILAAINGIKFPITLDDTTVPIPDNSIVAGSLGISNAHLDMKDLLINITALDSETITIVWTAGLSSEELGWDFNNDIRIQDTQLGGKGSVLVTANEFHFDGQLTASLNSLSPLDIKVADISSKLSLGDAKFQLTGLLNDDEFSKALSDFLTDNTAKLINGHAEKICVVINAIIKFVIDTITI